MDHFGQGELTMNATAEVTSLNLRAHCESSVGVLRNRAYSVGRAVAGWLALAGALAFASAPVRADDLAGKCDRIVAQAKRTGSIAVIARFDGELTANRKAELKAMGAEITR